MKKNFKIIVAIMSISILSMPLNVKAEIYEGKDAFKNHRMKPSENILYYLDNNETQKYAYHTDAFKNAINKFSNISGAGIGFIESNNQNDYKLKMTSANSSKYAWLGICQTTYNPYTGNVIAADVYINDYEVKSGNLEKTHVYETALHEIGHAFGLGHQEQQYSELTIMAPYLYNIKAGRVDLQTLDKNNIISEYPSANDWNNSWAKNEIKYAMDNKWVNVANVFRPEEAITRAEFIKVVNKAFGFTTKASSENFNDVKSSDWWYGEVLIAINAGYIDAKQAKFRPNDKISREEVASIVTSIKKNKDTNLDKIKKFSDYGKISSWARSSVEGAVEAGYMGKGSTSFRPTANITRAESVVTLYRIVK